MLLVTIHDVSPPTLDAARRLRDETLALGVDAATLLVIPNLRGENPLARSRETTAWLRERAAGGDEICLHGYYHQLRRRPRGVVRRARAALLGDLEAECLALDERHRRKMVMTGRAILEELTGVPVLGFIAPAWEEPPGFGLELKASGFLWHATRSVVERIAPTLDRLSAPLLWFGVPRRVQALAALGWAGGLGGTLRDRAAVRVAIHPTAVDHPDILESARAAIGRLVERHQAVTCAEAVGADRLASLSREPLELPAP